MRRTSTLLSVVATWAALALLTSGVALADYVTNDVTSTATGKILTVQAGTSAAVDYSIQNQNERSGDTQGSCNPADGTGVTIAAQALPAGVTANSPVATACGNDVATITYVVGSAVAAADYPLTHSFTDGGGGVYVDQAAFTLRVTAAADPCASVTAPASPTFATAGGTAGSAGWWRSAPSVSASSTTAGATITYATEVNGGAKSAYASVTPTLGEGSTKVYALATSTTCSKTSESTQTLKVDSIAPAVTPGDVADPAWRTGLLTQAFTAGDGSLGSGLANAADASFSLTASLDSVKNEDGTVRATSASRTVSDVAGNSTTRTLSAKIDSVLPVISGSDVTSSTWRNTDLSQSFTASDALSGLATLSDAAFTLTASAQSTKDGDGNVVPTVVNKTVADQAGNSATRTLSARIDKTAPTVTCPAAPQYQLNQATPGDVVAAVSDPLSGAASASASAAPDVSKVGTWTVSITGYDHAGNSKVESCSYTVNAVSSGFSAPVDRAPWVNKAKVGRNVPLKWRVTDANGVAYTSLTSSQVSVRLDGASTCGTSASTDEVEVYSTSTSGLQNLGDGYYQIDWKTPSTAGCRTVTVVLPGGGGPAATFSFTK